ncbi:TPA: hypothetical protein N0F65_000438 [Lagenidium giganteum]|uniref:Chromo domain-containing protein n=1 Tax=Lagenidium giganteum TaxID=4803 RepID=A0AAV2YJW9_9STRA|nr:TPA: hypothetical protein N0F65_000438 [Lagenidium giganteum]
MPTRFPVINNVPSIPGILRTRTRTTSLFLQKATHLRHLNFKVVLAGASSRDSRGSPPARRQARFQRDPPATLLDQNGDQHWIVERIVDRRDPAVTGATSGARGTRNPNQAVTHRAREYRVRWLGFPPDADTWEPRGSLHRDVPDLVAEYNARVRHEPVDTRGNAACSEQ